MIDTTSREYARDYLSSEGFVLPADADRAHVVCLERAQQGNVVAQSVLAALFATGLTCAENQELALHWARVAANNGSSDAKRMVATYMLSGAAGPKDPVGGLALLQELVQTEHLPSMVTMGILLMTGHSEAVKQDEVAAVDMLLGPAQAGDAFSQALVGSQLIEDSNLSRRVAGAKWIAMAAEAGVASAHRYLAKFFRFGEHGYPVDPERAAAHDATARQLEQSEFHDGE